MKYQRTFTSEAVTEGHPDKVCDQISDGVLDAYLTQDPGSRVACETAAAADGIVVLGEISSKASVDRVRIVRETVRRIGYTASHGFDPDTISVDDRIVRQSPNIAAAVSTSTQQRARSVTDPYDGQGAGDQGLMFGYACNETPERMPLAIVVAQSLARRLTAARRTGEVDYLGPDGKTQVTFECDGSGGPVRLTTVLVSTQHRKGVEQDQIHEDIVRAVIEPEVPERFASDGYRVLVNPSGSFEIGGPAADAGLTGRKIIVDSYGGAARHGGGAFSGKDASKVDRSGAYAARHLASHVVAAGAAARCEVQVAYAIGSARPVSVFVETFGTAEVDPVLLGEVLSDLFDLRPLAIIDRFGLRRPIFQQVSCYGHFGRPDLDLPWERLDHLDELCKKLGLVTP